ncbi:MAG: metallophosphoesterase family protein [Planctomycetota bacterium]|jgi:hypothetical protein
MPATLSGVISKIAGEVPAGLFHVCLLVAALCTACVAQSPWRFIGVCDSRGRDDGIEKAVLRELVAEIRNKNVDFVLFPGDLVSGHSVGGPAQFESQLRAWVEVMKPVYDAGVGVYVCRGNHEIADAWGSYGSSNLDPNDNFTTRWLEVFGNDLYPEQMLPDNGPTGERYMTYSVRHKNALVVLLDQYAGLEHRAVHKVNQQWLDEQLAVNSAEHIFVAGHEPAFRALHTDCLDNYVTERDTFWASIRNAGGRTYFCGHDHFYDHARIDDGDGNPDNDIHQFISGAGGAPPYSWSPPYSGNNSGYEVEQWHHDEGYGYTLVEIDGSNVTLTWMKRDTDDLTVQASYEPRDTWSYRVTRELVVLAPNGGERLVAAKPYTIRWKITGAEVDSVMIEYFNDGDRSWRQIAQSPNTGSYEWDPVPTTDAAECLIRITDARNAALSDTSDNAFTMFECRKQMPADLNGDCYVNFLDFAILAGDWLNCGNPFDASCD